MFAQTNLQEPPKQRILFVLDASGSMKKQWGSNTKFEIAKKMLYQLADSIATNEDNIELGIRVFGHQHPRGEFNCTDSNLEVPFAADYNILFKESLEKVQPQGHTPIAYSLLQAAADFPEDDQAINSIILITDGEENCEGNPCEASALLQEKRITINPFIIGLDIEDSVVSNFDCIGTFVNAKDETSFQKVLVSTVASVTAETTFEVNLISDKGGHITNTAFSMIDAYSGTYLYNFIHAITKEGKSDTMRMDPRGTYTIQVHMKPNLFVENIQLEVGKHNIINIPIRKGFIAFKHQQLYDEHAAHFVVKENGESDILFNYELQNDQFLVGNYYITSTFVPLEPLQLRTIPLESTLSLNIPSNGTLSIDNKSAKLASIYTKQDDKYVLVKDLGVVSSDYSTKLQPGDYILVFVSRNTKDSNSTSRKAFTIYSQKTSVVALK